MNAAELILTEVYRHLRRWAADVILSGFTWDDQTYLRVCILRHQHHDAQAWYEFVQRFEGRRRQCASIRKVLDERGWVWLNRETDRLEMGAFPSHVTPLTSTQAVALLRCLQSSPPGPVEELPSRPRASRTEVMYIEAKDGLTGPARIGRVTFSKTRSTIYYRRHKFQSLKGTGYKANYRDVDTRVWYWNSRCRADGQDTLYPGIVEIDEDVREEYWLTIRKLPAMVKATSFRSEGKYSRRRRQPEKSNHPATGSRSGSACAACR